MPASSAAEHASEASVRTGAGERGGQGGGGRKWCGIGRVVRSAETGPPDCDAKTFEGRMFEETGRKDGYQRRPIWKRRVKTQPTELD